MFITVNNLKKTLGKYVEFTDLYIGVPCLVVFIVLFFKKQTHLQLVM